MMEINKELLEAYVGDNEDSVREAIEAIVDGGWEAAIPKISTRPVARALVLLLSQIFYDEFHYPQPQKGKYDVANNSFEKLKWVYRYWFNQLEVAEKGSGIEEYFRKQILEFPLPEGFEETQRMTMSSGGDILAVDVLTGDNTKHLFDEVADFYFDADIRCANLESTIYADAPFGRNQIPGEAARMNTSVEVFENCNQNGRGINFFSTANNHSYDYGDKGLKATLEVLKDVYHTGTNGYPEDQDKILIIEQNGIKIAMLSYTMDLNGHEPDREDKYMVNEVRFNDEKCDIGLIEKHVALAREAGADIVAACCHWGWEFEMYPHSNVMAVGHRVAELGVDVILGNHPHVAQPMERYSYEKDGMVKDVLIAYSCGDFVAFHPESRNSKISYIIKFDIAKGKQNGRTAAYITDLKMLPVYMLNEQIKGSNYNCRMLRFRDVADDRGEGGGYKYNLLKKDRGQLPHLDEVVLQQILLPEEHEGLLVE